jgi:chemotaxis protein histidine kinase CheA
MPKIQQTLNDRGAGITLDCPIVDGAMSMQIVAKPDGMSQEEAEQLVFSDEFYTVRGAWTFPVTFSQ